MKRLIAFALLAVCLGLCLPCQAGGAWIAVVPEAESVARDGSVGATVRLGWWDASPGFALIRVTYDAKLLTCENVEVLDSRVSSVNTAKGTLTLVYSPAAGETADAQPGTAETELVRITLKGVKKGNATVTPAIVSITDSRWLGISAESAPTVINVR